LPAYLQRSVVSKNCSRFFLQVAGKDILKYEIPEEFTGIARYLAAADETEEFVNTCPDPDEIVWTYGGRKPKPKKQQ